MKKEYITPEMTEIKIAAVHQMLAGSPMSGGASMNDGYDGDGEEFDLDL